MRYPAEETAQKHRMILDEAARAFRKQGFYGASVAKIMENAGLTHGPFYNHFSSKIALKDETLRWLSADLLQRIDAMIADGGVDRMVQRYASAEHRDNEECGCFLPSLASEAARIPELHGAFAAHIDSLIDRVSAQLDSKELARKEAIKMVTMMVGAVLLSRSVGKSALSEEILDAAAG